MLKNLNQEVRKELDTLPQDVVGLLCLNNLLRQLIHRMVINQACQSISLTSPILDQAMARFCEEHELSNQEQINRYLDHQGLSQSDLMHQLSIPLKMQRLSLEHFSSKAESRFLQRKEDLDNYTYSLIRVDHPDLAHELYLQIQAGEADFTALATAHSQGRERASHGLVGPASLSRAHPLLQQKLRTATPGVLIEPFRIEQWWVVTRLEERQLATFDSTMKQRMARELLEVWVEQQTSQIVESFHKKHHANALA